MANKMCGICGKIEASDVCAECKIPICDVCAKVVTIPEESLGYLIRGEMTSPMRAGEQKRKVCQKCLETVEFL